MSGPIQRLAGVIEEVTICNFMCHESFHMKFNPEVNFISGKNGSGKSAILTAIIVGLGGKAIATSRGKNMGAFVKYNETTAKIEIHLKNTGDKKYEPDKFGSKIIVIRKFGPKSSSYLIQNDKHHTIYNRAADLSKILNHFNIQIDNPLCVLNQDVSRSFLNSSNSNKKYTFFLKATQLEIIYEELRCATDNAGDIKLLIDEEKATCQKLKKEYKVVEKQYHALNTFGVLSDKLKKKQNELLWCKVIEFETKITQLEEELKSRLEQKNKIDDRLSKCSQSNDSFQTHLQTIERSIKDLKNQINDMDCKKREVCQKREKIQESIDKIKSDIQFENRVLKLKVDSKADIERAIEENSNRCTQIEDEKEKFIENKRNYEEKLKNISALLSTTNNDLFQAKGSLEHETNENRAIYSEIQKFNFEIDKIKRNIEYLKSNASNKYSIYGKKINTVMEAIKMNERKFKQLPRGPMGLYVSLKEKKWAASVEYNLGSDAFESFIVDNASDHKLLTDIFNNIYHNEPKPSIVCTKFFNKIHNVYEHKIQHPPQNTHCLFDQFIMKDPVVGNYLIDSYRIEAILLVETDQMAMQLMSDEQNVPKNCRSALTLAGDKYFPAPGYKTYGATAKIAPKYFHADCDSQIERWKKEMQNLQENVHSCNTKMNAIRKDINEQTKHVQELERRRKQLIDNEVDIRNALSNIQVQFDKKTSDNSECLKISLEDTIKAIESIKEAIQAKEAKISEILDEEQSLLQIITEMNTQNGELFAKKNELVTEYDKERETIANEGSRRTHLLVKLKVIDKSCKELKTELEALQERYKSKLAAAQSKCDRITELKPYDELYAECQALEEDYKSVQLHVGNQEDITRKFSELGEKLKECLTMSSANEKNLDLILEGLSKRKRIVKHITRTTTNQIQTYFQEILKYRNFEGSLKISHEQQQLDIFVVPSTRERNQNLTPENVCTLSGGERSYCTVAFILSLWNSMHFPFHFLDEFDVFMDRVNRQIIMDLLLIFARNNKDSQFVFLTPQDISDIKADSCLSIHKLQNPEK